MKSNRIALPSGVEVSKDGKYRYWRCSVSGLETFAKPDYWVKIMAKFGSEENLVKTYVCRRAMKLLDEGLSAAEIRLRLSGVQTREGQKQRKQERAARVEKKQAKLAERRETKRIKAERKALTKRVRKTGLKTFAVGKIEMEVQTDTGSFVKEEVPVYPWQGKADYFGSGVTAPTSVSETTKDACALPNRFLDDECRNCPLYAECTFERKFTADDWKKGKRAKEEVKVTPLKSFGE